MNILDFDEDSIVLIPFSTNAQDGGAIGPSDAFELADFVVYQDTFNTGKETTDGMFIQTNWAGITGLHMLLINTAVDTGNVSFAWQAGSVYTVCIRPDETVDGKTVVKWIGSFRLGYVALALKNAILAAIVEAGVTFDIISPVNTDENGDAQLSLTIRDDYTDENGNPIELDIPAAWPDLTTIPLEQIYLGFGDDYENPSFQVNATEKVSARRIKFEPRKSTTTNLPPGDGWSATVLVDYGDGTEAGSARRSFNMNLEVVRSWVS